MEMNEWLKEYPIQILELGRLATNYFGERRYLLDLAKRQLVKDGTYDRDMMDYLALVEGSQIPKSNEEFVGIQWFNPNEGVDLLFLDPDDNYKTYQYLLPIHILEDGYNGEHEWEVLKINLAGWYEDLVNG